MKVSAKFRAISAAVVISMLTSACGTILYPERRGQTSGTIDPGVALLNTAGLIVFFVPGVIAFAVDFITGAIYLPEGKTVMLNQQGLDQISPDGQIDKAKLTTLLQHKFPGQYRFEASQLQARRMNADDNWQQPSNRLLAAR